MRISNKNLKKRKRKPVTRIKQKKEESWEEDSSEPGAQHKSTHLNPAIITFVATINI